MIYEEIEKKVTLIFREVLDNDRITLSRKSTAGDVDGWDSLTHINLIFAIEKEFKIRFNLAELKPLQNVGELLDLVQKKISQQSN